MHPNAQRVQQALEEQGYTGKVVELEASTRTAVEAAAACGAISAAGCLVGQIVKSLVFRLEPQHTPVLVLVSGDNRVHEKHLGKLLGVTLERADAEWVREISGFAIGGVPPVALKTPLTTFMDEDLLRYDIVWGAAGTPNSVFPIDPHLLQQISQAEVVCVK